MNEKQTPSLEEIARVVREVIDREFGQSKDPSPQSPVAPIEEDRPRRRQQPKPELITQQMVLDAQRTGKDLVVPSTHIMTPLAKDTIDELGIKVVYDTEPDRPDSDPMKSPVQKLVVWTDRFSKDLMKTLLDTYGSGFEVTDLSSDEDLIRFAQLLSDDSKARGVAISEKGSELAVLLNKYSGVRAVFGESVEPVVSARQRVAANALVLSSQQTSQQRASEIVDGFLNTEFQNPRYKELIQEILNAEKMKA